jgi:hypothetical protein
MLVRIIASMRRVEKAKSAIQEAQAELAAAEGELHVVSTPCLGPRLGIQHWAPQTPCLPATAESLAYVRGGVLAGSPPPGLGPLTPTSYRRAASVRLHCVHPPLLQQQHAPCRGGAPPHAPRQVLQDATSMMEGEELAYASNTQAAAAAVAAAARAVTAAPAPSLAGPAAQGGGASGAGVPAAAAAATGPRGTQQPAVAAARDRSVEAAAGAGGLGGGGPAVGGAASDAGGGLPVAAGQAGWSAAGHGDGHSAAMLADAKPKLSFKLKIPQQV